MTDTPAFAFGDKIELFDGSAARRFVGWSCEPSPQLEEPRHDIEFEGPNRWLESGYKASANFFDGSGTLYGDLTPNVILFQSIDVADGAAVIGSVNLSDQVGAILAYAKATGNRGAAAPFDYDLTGLPTVQPPQQPRSGITCLQALQFCMVHAPGITWHWDYSGTGNPVLRFVRLQTIASDGTLLNPPTLSGAGYATIRTLPNDGTIIAKMKPEPVDNRIGILEIAWLYQTGDYATRRRVLGVESSTCDNGSPRTIQIPVQLGGYVFNGTAWVDAEQPPPAGLARLLHDAFARVLFKFRFGTDSDDLHWEWVPGADVWNVSSAAAAWATAFSVSQVVVRDFLTGEVDVLTGPPNHRGLGDLQAVKLAARPVPPGQSGGSAQYGSVEPDPVEPEVTLDPEGPNFYPPSENPSVAVTKTAPGAFRFLFGLVKAWKLAIGTITTGAAGSSASISDASSTSDTKIWDITIPRGDKGDTGDPGSDGGPGPKGDKGDPGDPGSPGTSYLPDPSGLPDGRYVIRVTSGVATYEAE